MLPYSLQQTHIYWCYHTVYNKPTHTDVTIQFTVNPHVLMLPYSLQQTHTYWCYHTVYSKPTHTDDTIQFCSNHSIENKFTAFNFYVNWILKLPITKQTKQQEWKIIITVGQNNGFLLHIIHNLKNKLIAKNKNKASTHNYATRQKVSNILISESTNTKNNLFLKTL